MSLRYAMPLVLAGLVACELGPSEGSTRDADGASGGPTDDGGTNDLSSFSIRPEPPGTAPLTAATLSGILPPSWHVGESWEVMFCRAGDHFLQNGEYDTTRILFKVIAVPQPGAYTAVVEVKQHMFPYKAWVGEVLTVNGEQVGRGQDRIILKESFATKLNFDGQSFRPILDVINTPGGLMVDYKRITDDMMSTSIFEYTPHVPLGLDNPEITNETMYAPRTRSTITPTHDGIVYQAESMIDSAARLAVFWRRGEPWWSYARVDVVDLTSDMDAGPDEHPAPVVTKTVMWALKLAPGQPDNLNCNSKP